MDQRLRQAAQDGDIEAFYDLVGTDPYILEHIDGIPFVETPLHVAASLGHTEFAMEMMRLKPSFARKPNQDGFTPIHLALQNENINQQQQLVQQQLVLQQLVLSLLQVDPDLVRLKGREGETALHYAARIGNLDLLAKFLLVCPDSIKDVTIRSETALHIALKYNMLDAFQVLLGWLNRAAYDNTLGLRETILNWKNFEGNTALHIATSNNLAQASSRSECVNKDRVAVNEKNLSGLTALDILESLALGNQEIEDMLCRAKALLASEVDRKFISLADYLRAKVPFTEPVLKYVFRIAFYMPNGKRNAFLVVAVLIATATYQAGLSPPAGLWQDDYNPPPTDLNTTTITPSSSSPPSHHAGKSVLSTSDFLNISLLNSTAFWLSTAIIFILLPIGPGGVGLRMAILILYASYMMCMSCISPNRVGEEIFVWLLSISLVILAAGYLVLAMSYRGTHRSSGARRIGTLPDLVPRKGLLLLH